MIMTNDMYMNIEMWVKNKREILFIWDLT